MQIVLITVTYNAEKYIETFLHSLTEQGVNLHLVVVDNNSHDQTVEKIKKFYQVNMINNSIIVDIIKLNRNVFYGPAIDIAVRHLIKKYNYDPNTTILIISNPDVIFEKDSIKNLVNNISKNDIIQCNILKEDGKRIDNQGFLLTTGLTMYKLGENAERGYISKLTRYITFISGACFATYFATFLSIGGFHPAIDLYCDDVELSLRAICKGYRLGVATNAYVIHFESQTMSHQARKWYYIIKNCGYVAFRYLGFRYFLLYLLSKFFVTLQFRNPYMLIAYIKGASKIITHIHKLTRVKCKRLKVYSYVKLIKFSLWQDRRRQKSL